MKGSLIKTLLKIMLATAGFGLLHSFLASSTAKRWARLRFGERQRNGLYRPFFILQSLITFSALSAYALSLPDRVIYRAGPGWSRLMRIGQGLGLGYAVWAAAAVGLERISGWRSLSAWAQGKEEVPPEPEAQGPRPQIAGGMRVAGPFRWSRHPLNFSPLPVLWLNPVMTTRLLAFNLAATVYLVLGSVHEEQRLLEAYGPAYRQYLEKMIPFFLPRPH